MAFLTEVTVTGFRGFAETQNLHLAVPIDGKPGSGLTILVGPNNGGKSSLLEAIYMVSKAVPVTLQRSDRNVSCKYMADFTAAWDDGTLVHLRSDPGNPGSVASTTTTVQENSRIAFFVPARRTISDELGQGEVDRAEYGKQCTLSETRGLPARPFHGRIRAMQSRWEKVSPLLDNLIDFDLSIMTEGNTLHVNTDRSEHRPLGLGSGIISLLHIVDSLYDARDGSTILIDEPELSLHPGIQTKLRALLERYSAKIQVIYATQSPYLVSWPALLADATLARVFREPAGCRIEQLQRQTARDVGRLLEDHHNPHAMGTNAKEVFFQSDRVILVEGQEDVIFYRLMAAAIEVELAGDFYGWGVGGAGKMTYIAALLHDLGYTRVAGVLDKGKEQVAKQLEERFPEYWFTCIPTTDVRDKEAEQGQVCVKGLCDRKGRIHEEHRSTVKTLFQKLSDYLNS